jgi:hypothetical protein
VRTDKLPEVTILIILLVYYFLDTYIGTHKIDAPTFYF